MTDPLAHLYGDLSHEADEDALEEPPTVPVSLDGLNGELDPERDEQISERDLDELVLLVKARLENGAFTDEEAAELGLGEIYNVNPNPDAPEEGTDLRLNAVGRAVLARLIDERLPGIRP